MKFFRTLVFIPVTILSPQVRAKNFSPKSIKNIFKKLTLNFFFITFLEKKPVELFQRTCGLTRF